MIFTETKLKGAFVIELERREDERGFFARTFCRQEFRERGLEFVIAQAGVASGPIDNGSMRRRFGRCYGCAASNAAAPSRLAEAFFVRKILA